MQVDFCVQKVMLMLWGYDLGLTSAPIKPTMHVLDTIRKGTDVKVIHTREGHLQIFQRHHTTKFFAARL
jgi:biuret amidohydrolase